LPQINSAARLRPAGGHNGLASAGGKIMLDPSRPARKIIMARPDMRKTAASIALLE
jgi:hypothetical protein